MEQEHSKQDQKTDLNEAPKKIWVRELPRKEDMILIGLSYHTKPQGLENCTEHQYIRADLVDGLVEALKICLAGNGYEFDDRPAEAALKALEEE